MFRFDVSRWVPKFILNDKNGYALARAIEAAMNYMNQKIRTGVGILLYVDEMPEWRLDELAEELDCLYDYDADIEAKRTWIKNALPYYKMYGTPKALRQFLFGYFDDIEVEENWKYSGDPYHFRVTVEGVWNPKNETWAKEAIEKAKNVRSVLDALRLGCRTSIAITAEGFMAARFNYPMTGGNRVTGTWPDMAYLGELEKVGQTVETDEKPAVFPYTLTGTLPDPNIIGSSAEANTAAGGEADGVRFPYPETSESQKAGTRPGVNTLGESETVSEAAGATADGTKFPYPETSESQKAGTRPGINTLGESETVSEAAGATADGTEFPYPETGTNPRPSTITDNPDKTIQAADADDVYATIDYTLCGQDGI